MKPAEVILSLAAVVSATAYLLASPAVALIGVVLMAYYALARLSFEPRVRVSRRFPARGTEKEPLKAEIHIENDSPIPGVLKIRETSEKAFAKDLRVELKPGERRYVTQTIVPQSKGRVDLKGKAEFEDALGLFKEDVKVEEHGGITVFPSPGSIGEAMKERRQVEALAEAEKALGIGAETLDFEELREFMPGDDIIRVDWKATSRLQTLIVRVFKRETLADVYLLINVAKEFRREMRPGRIDYLVLITSQLTAYFKHFGHAIKVIAYDDSGVVKVIENASDPLKVVLELGLKGERGLPQITPSRLSPKRSSLGRTVSKLRKGTEASGPVAAAMKVESGAYVLMVDALGLHPGEIIKASRILDRKGAKAVLLYPNPVLFMSKKDLTKEKLETLYRAYRERKEMMKRVIGWIKVIEVGPRDLLPKVVRKL